MYEFDWMLQIGLILFGCQCGIFLAFTTLIICHFKDLIDGFKN